jgi:hypothetical protein
MNNLQKKKHIRNFCNLYINSDYTNGNVYFDALPHTYYSSALIVILHYLNVLYYRHRSIIVDAKPLLKKNHIA